MQIHKVSAFIQYNFIIKHANAKIPKTNLHIMYY